MAFADISDGPYRPDFESLGQFVCPDWFQDAKLGIWSHWGPQSVPMMGDWYARYMYIEDSEAYRHHVRVYGHPSKFGYKDLVQLWKAEKFDPLELMDLYYAAGARYFVAQAMHHDHFFNYNSRLHRWNAVNMGPGKDIVALWQDAARQYKLPFGVSEHLGATYTWLAQNKSADRKGPYAGIPYDGHDPQFEDFYLPNADYTLENPDLHAQEPWYAPDPAWHRRWFQIMKELIDRYDLDLLYTDGGVPFGQRGKSLPDDPAYAAGLHAIAHLYNSSARRHGGVNQAVYTQKDARSAIAKVGVLDHERSREREMRRAPWQTDTCIGDFFYNTRAAYHPPGLLIEMLVDVVSKNGNLLMNVPQKPDGSLDEECIHILREMAKWHAVCGEAIQGTRPYTVSGEGPLMTVDKEEAMPWTTEDIRFTRKGNVIYAFLMKWPEQGSVAIRSLARENVARVRLLGAAQVPFAQTGDALQVQLPIRRPTAYVNALAVELHENCNWESGDE